MNKNNKIYLIILAVLVVLFLITKMNNKTEKIIDFFDVDSVKIAKFSVTDANGTITLQNVNGSWEITDPIQYKADQAKVENVFDKVLNAKTSSLPLSDSQQSLPNYELQDSVAVFLTFFDVNDKVLDATYFGKMKGQSKTPARKENSNEVFLLDQSVHYLLKADTQNWREKTVTTIEEESIEKISVLYDDSGYELSKQDTAWFYADGDNTATLKEDNSTVRSIVTALKRVTSTQFKDNEFEKYEAALAKPDLEIGVVQLDGNSVYLRLAKDDESKYVMQLNNDTETLFIQHEGWAKRFMKTFQDFEEK
ncbi:MAG: DUF4340 domain-containing protein [Candidatus Cloacimonetes bacterium]|nr:DUF4340 domain-containing protein [Candidatus Cloacimonadota bacterium]MCF7815039.1 DUF4340 domain-containing protein [Candidatus Cloacimonadota bacterium]MCF7868365.1 DUF4340 domain-containing protein [Candidatus Cloacimonadota bacterium]MCF7883869.1 DUF4340 domain-containing protein [Candidatus Cloacimonadota bacterium]